MDFKQGYNKSEFKNFLRTRFLGDKFEEISEQLVPIRKTQFFADNGIYKIGEIKGLNKEMSILEIRQRSRRDPRITLTKDTFKLMQDYGIRNAIIVFYIDEHSPWRFSLLTTNFTEDFKKELSSPKRYSYLLGPGEKTKTPEKYLLKQITDYDDLISRFDVEVVRKEFFEQYLELYVKLYKEIKEDDKFVDMLYLQKIDIVSFTKNLLGKIVFLYFIQQKGWLGLGRKEKEYGKGNRDFMRVMRDNFKKSNESISSEKTGYFYNDYLERLFFAGLNQDRRDNDDRFPNLQMKVPFLNGGLFKEDYQGREGYVVKIDNDIFSNVDKKGDEADGILDIFDRYNFTVDEDSLYDSDVAVDPEMLGRIFEKMISISNENIDEIIKIFDAKGKKTKIDFGKELNKKLGAFYTPREIVHYMTKEVLISYLVNNIKGDKEGNEKLVRNLFNLKEQFLLNKDDLAKTGFSHDILDRIGGIVGNIDEALKKVKILDPAVGSGAFPMGLLYEISSVRYYIYGVFNKILGTDADIYKNQEGKISMYKIKREIILNNIYGVDIDPGAIDIARLRFWLSLVVDEEVPEPLPNFEFKFVCANTLIPLGKETKEKDLFAQGDEPKLETLKKYKREYYNASSNKEKKEKKDQIKNYTKSDINLFSDPTPRAKQIEEFGVNFDNSKHSHSFFDPSLMMSEWRGFDVIIGNPPYLEFEELRQNDKNFEFYKSYYGVNYKFNLYCMFTLLHKFLLKEGGFLSYIIPNSFSKEKYNHIIRHDYVFNRSILKIVDFSEDSNVFENAANDGYIVYLLKNNPTSKNIIDIDGYKNKHFIKLCSLSQEIFKTTYQNQFNISPRYFLSLKIESNTIPLGKIAFTRVGLTPSKGYKKEYGDEYTSRGLKNEYSFIKYNSSTEGIQGKYIIIDGGKKLVWDRELLYQDKVCPGEFEDYIYEKIILRNRGNILYGSYSKDEIFYNDLFNGITLKYNYKKDRIFDVEDVEMSKKFQIKYILSILNSHIMQFYLNNKFNTRDIKSPMINIIPIKQISLEEQNAFIEKVDKILAITKQVGYDSKNISQEQLNIEEEIDQMVYELYGLDTEEMKVVEESLK